MAKNILIFSDGTGQEGGLTPDQHISNIYKLYRASRNGPDSPIDPRVQVAFYDAGLGTNRDEGRIHVRPLQATRKAISAGLGLGISRNIADCYEAILKFYEPGDRIFLFGFSRGAYTARCVAGVMALCGVPTRGGDGGPLPRYGRALRAIADEAVHDVYEHGAGRDRAQFEAERQEQGRRFRERYGSDADGRANVSPYFIGVFDTVASLGARGLKKLILNAATVLGIAVLAALLSWPISLLSGQAFWLTFSAVCSAIAVVVAVVTFRSSLRVIRDYPDKGDLRWHLAGWRSGFYDFHLDPRVRFGRHALAIDETRADFARVPWARKGDNPPREPGEPEWLQQIWFAGCHSDIGGSYAEEESRLSDIALDWMVRQATSVPHPIVIDASKLRLFPDPAGMQHSEVESLRELYPTWWPSWARGGWKEKPRIEALGAPLHASVFERFRAPAVLHYARSKPYRPETLRGDERLKQFYEG